MLCHWPLEKKSQVSQSVHLYTFIRTKEIKWIGWCQTEGRRESGIHQVFPTMMDCNLKPWAKIYPSFLKLLSDSYLVTATKGGGARRGPLVIAGEMSQQLRYFPEGQSLSSQYPKWAAHSHPLPWLQEIQHPLLASVGTHMHMYVQIHRHTHINNKKSLKKKQHPKIGPLLH